MESNTLPGTSFVAPGVLQQPEPLKPMAALQDELERMAIVAEDLSRLVVGKVEGLLGPCPVEAQGQGHLVGSHPAASCFMASACDATKRIRIAMMAINEEVSRL